MKPEEEKCNQKKSKNKISQGRTDEEFETLDMPLTPNRIPQSNTETSKNCSSAATISDGKRKIKNPLGFEPGNGITYFLQLPGLLFGAILCGYLLGRFKLSVFLLLIPAHIIYFILKRRAKTYERTLEALNKEKHRKDNLGEFETVEWLNYIVRKFWEVSESSVSSMIYTEVNKVLKENTPKILKSLKLTELTLGTRPPVVERIGFINKNEDVIIVECAVNFIPVQTSQDLLAYFGEEKRHWNTCIELTATVGFIKLPILVRNFALSGICKMEINLSRKLPFLKSFGFSMLEEPMVDFELEPLKTVDFMDIPYLSSFIYNVISSQVKTHLLAPNSITIPLENIADYKGKMIGVLYTHIDELDTPDEESVMVELSTHGRSFAKTTRKFGKDPIFNEGFFSIIHDTNRTIGVTLHTPTEKRTGSIFLRNLNKHAYSESVNLSSEGSRRILNVHSMFYPISQQNESKYLRSAIVNMNLVSISDLQGLKDPINRIYSTYCRIKLETKETIRVRTVLDTFETKRIFSTKNPFYNENIKFFVRNFDDYVVSMEVVNEKDDSTIGTLVIPLSSIENNVFSSYKLGQVENGDAEIKFKLTYVDMTENWETIRDHDEELDMQCENETVLLNKKCPTNKEESHDSQEGSIQVDEENIEIEKLETLGKTKRRNHGKSKPLIGTFKMKKTKAQKLKSVVHEKIEIQPLELGIYNLEKPNNKFVEFSKVARFTIDEMKEQGNFYLIFESRNVTCKTAPFTAEYLSTTECCVPLVANETEIKARLFRMNSNGDSLISEEVLEVSEETVAVFDKIRIKFKTEITEKINDKFTDDSENMKIVQLRITKLDTTGKCYLNCSSSTVLRDSRDVNSLNIAAIGSEKLSYKFYRNNIFISEFDVLPVAGKQSVNIANSIACEMEVAISEVKYKKERNLDRGILQVFILKAAGIKPISGQLINPYVKLYMNNEKVFKTRAINNTTSPAFNERVKFPVRKNIDYLTFYLYDNSTLASGLVAYADVPLFHLKEKFARINIVMADAETGLKDSTTLEVILKLSENDDDNSLLV
ncbi:hypothetical protein ENBRE01_0396 [Enteropsectra breve]|nr:hypothetical protein ENBRE01_0396 [Enteropsectra breve]